MGTEQQLTRRTFERLTYELIPHGESGLVSSGLGQMMPDTKFLLPISAQLSPLINPLLVIIPCTQTKYTKDNAFIQEIGMITFKSFG